jgi:hypothetical protein
MVDSLVSFGQSIAQTYSWKELDYVRYQSIWGLDVQPMRQDLKEQAKASHAKPLVAFAPDREIAATMIHCAIVCIPSFMSNKLWLVWDICLDGAGTPFYTIWNLDHNPPALTLTVT